MLVVRLPPEDLGQVKGGQSDRLAQTLGRVIRLTDHLNDNQRGIPFTEGHQEYPKILCCLSSLSSL